MKRGISLKLLSPHDKDLIKIMKNTATLIQGQKKKVLNME